MISCSQNDAVSIEEENVTKISARGGFDLNTYFSNITYSPSTLSTFESVVENSGIYKKVKTQQVLLANDDFNDLIKKFSFYHDVDFQNLRLRGVVFYGDEVGVSLIDFRNLTLMILDDKGYSYFVSYVKNGKDITLVEDNPQKHSLILMNYFAYLGSKLNLNNNSMLTILTDKTFESEADPQLVNNVSSENLKHTIFSEYDYIPYGYETKGSYCTVSACDVSGPGHCAAVYPDPRVSCNGDGGGDCSSRDVGEPGYYQPEHLSPVAYVYNAAMYSIRDNFLMNSPKGKEYVDFYYKLSYAFKALGQYDFDNVSLAELTWKIRIKAVEFVSASDDDIIVSNSDYVFFKDKISEYKILSNNNEYQYIFKTLESDLDFLKNKTKSEFKQYFKD